MDYGDRQERAKLLVRTFRDHSDQTTFVYQDEQGVSYRAHEIADHIERQSDLGTSVVAVAGFVLQALTSRKSA